VSVAAPRADGRADMSSAASPAEDRVAPSDRFLRRPFPVALLAGAVVVFAFVALPVDHALVAALTGATLVVISAIDIGRRIIPNRIVLPAAAIVFVAQVALFPGRAGEWALAGILAALFFLIPNVLSRKLMGMGDVKLALLLGVALGWQAAGAVALAFLCVFPVALFLLARGGLAARKATIPFGPFLSLGALIMLFVPHLTS
jgi:leader peptidase (prepilin peptidase) / N-methyltransferase